MATLGIVFGRKKKKLSTQGFEKSSSKWPKIDAIKETERVAEISETV